jgi:acyl carrier protein
MEKDKIFEIVLTKLTELNDTMPADQKFNVGKDTVLFGNNSSIDSLSLVSVIVDIETAFSEEHDHDISLTDDRAMTREINPFENVSSLVDYIYEVVNEKK